MMSIALSILTLAAGVHVGLLESHRHPVRLGRAVVEVFDGYTLTEAVGPGGLLRFHVVVPGVGGDHGSRAMISLNGLEGRTVAVFGRVRVENQSLLIDAIGWAGVQRGGPGD